MPRPKYTFGRNAVPLFTRHIFLQERIRMALAYDTLIIWYTNQTRFDGRVNNYRFIVRYYTYDTNDEVYHY